ncbi:MAG: SpoIIE family protein phosphatase [Bacteroidia bacterium]
MIISKTFKSISIAIFIVLFSSISIGQNNYNLDSIRSEYNKSNDDYEKLNSINWLVFYEYGKIDSSIKYFKVAEKEFKIRKYIFGEAYVNRTLAIVYQSYHLNDSAIKHYKASIKLFESIKNDTMIAKTCSNLGFVYYSQGDYDKSIEVYFLGLKFAKNSTDYFTYAWLHNQIGLSYSNKPNPNYKLALEYYMKSLDILKKNNFISRSGLVHLRIGSVYLRQKNDSKGLYYLNKALKIGKDYNNKTVVLWTQVAFAKYYIDHNQYNKAIELENYCVKQFISGFDVPGIIDSYKNLANCNHKLNNNKLALIQIDSAIYYSINNNVYEKFNKIYELKSDIHKALGQYDLAFEYFKKSVHVKDSIFSEANNKNIIELQTKFDTEGKEKEIQMLNVEKASDKKIKSILTVAFSVALILIVSIVFIVFKINKARKQLAFQKTEIELQKHVIEEKHKEITDSINYAERIQHSLLASNNILTNNLDDYFIYFQPKDVVSGDFYWATNLNNGTFALMCADSTGHGVPGSIMSILNISCLEKAIEVENLTAPNEILNHTRKKIIETLKKDGSEEGGKDGMDGSLMCFDFDRLVLNCACANNPIWVIRNNEIIEIKGDRFPIGKHDRDNVPFTFQTINLIKGDMIYTFTDGFQDQFGGPKGKKFKYKNLQDLLLKITTETLENQKQIVSSAFNNWKGNLEQVDDVTLIGIRI